MQLIPSKPILPEGYPCELRGHGYANSYAAALLQALGGVVQHQEGPANVHPAIAFARSGLMALSGHPDEPPQLCIAPLASCADGALKALAALAPKGHFEGLHGSALLSERAALTGFSREGPISPGGHCRLLDSRDGCIALNLARDDDWTLLGAWLGLDADVPRPDDWTALAAEVARHDCDELIERGRLLGLATAAANPALSNAAPWQTLLTRAENRLSAAGLPLVVDLSSLWAGPLCGHLLHKAGAQVIKVESIQRPDGARNGSHGFFDLLNAGKKCVALDFKSQQGREQLRSLLLKADIVIEASRPRALQQLGIHAEEVLSANPGLSWIAISGYGRGEPQEQWIAYGDDAGVAGGLTRLMKETTGQSIFVGDAIADPLTGLHAALAAWASHLGGGGRLIALSLCDVVRACLHYDLPGTIEARQARHDEWAAVLNAVSVLPAAPHARKASGSARPLGADTDTILQELGIPC
jgi:crotonobetainyl-CoA:carnitine CoA-transferase CaiB-like acyl-CoA transferase